MTASRATFALLAILAAPPLLAQAPLDHVPENRLRQMSKCPLISCWNPFSPQSIISQADVDFLKEAGFTCARVPIFWSRFLDPGLNPPERVNQTLAYLDWTIELLTSKGLGVVLRLDESDARYPLAGEPGGFDKLDELWRMLATRYRSSDPELVFFEFLSEPGIAFTKATWAALQRRVSATIRAAAPAHTIIATSEDYSCISTFLTLEPLQDRNVVYSFHFYPLSLGIFTFQGWWDEPILSGIKGLPYPSYLPEVRLYMEAASDPEVRAAVQSYIDGHWWSGHIDRLMAQTAAWGRHHGRPVSMTEFNLFFYAPPESRQRFVWDLRQAAERHGVGWTFHEYACTPLPLMVTHDGVRTPDPLLMQALGMAPWDGPTIPPPDFLFDGPDQLHDGPLFPDGTGVSAAAVIDLDADGLLDVVATPARFPAATGEPVVVLKNYFGGGVDDVTASTIEGDIPTTVNCLRIVIAELNGDARQDVFLPDNGFYPTVGQSRLLLSTEKGRYIDASANLPQQAIVTVSADAADTRGIGVTDLVLFNDFFDTPRAPLQLLSNNGHGHFTVDNGRLPAALVDTGRKDNVFLDGRFIPRQGAAVPDLVLVGRSHVTSVLLRNDGTGRFTPGSPLPPKPSGGFSNEVAMATADIDLDGVIDLLIGYTGAQGKGGYVQVLMGNRDGTFRDESAARITQPEGESPLLSLSFSAATAKSRPYLLLGFASGQSVLKTLDVRRCFVDEFLDGLADAGYGALLVDFNADELTDIVMPGTARAMYGIELVPHRPVRRALRTGN